MGSRIEFASNSPEETFNLGQRIALNLTRGSIVALNGGLGNGKTCLAKGIAAGLGITDCITSPTYTIINEYKRNETECAFFHIDAYRLNNEKDFEDIGGLEILSSNGICIIEWADKIKKLLKDNTITVTLEITGSKTRLIHIQGIEKL